jgi:Holliday junction resolvase RusA-like endonuclease
MRFTIPVPPSTNNLFATIAGKRRSTTDYLRWQREADMLVMTQKVKQEKVAIPVQITVTIPQSRHRRDLDNYLKAACDCMVRTGIIPDDSDLIVKRVTAQVGVQLECTVDVEPFIAGPRVEAIPHGGRVS